MANQVENPFADEKPQLVHFEKDESHYEVCRMQMHEIEHIHRRTFFCNMVLCIVVCALSMFQQYIAGFDLLSKPFMVADAPGMNLAGGIFQIIIAMVIILIGYLAWANFHTLNIFLACWYFLVAFIGIYRADYISAVVGAVGIVFYVFSIREMHHEERLSQMEGYPDFQEKFDISKSDIVIQTLMAHKGEHRTTSTLFTTEYSLRRKKKKTGLPEEKHHEGEKSEALAETLQKRLEEKRAQESEAKTEVPAEPELPAEDAAPEIAPADMDDLAETEAVAETAAEAVAEEVTEKAAAPAPAPEKPKTQPQNRPSGGGKKKKHKK